MKSSDESLDLNSKVVGTTFVTSYARMELYEGMNFVGPELLIYVDTDYVIALEGLGMPSLPVGDCLGQFKSEIGAENFYCLFEVELRAYKTDSGTEAFKAKEISINCSNVELFQTDTLEKMVLNPDIFHKILNPYKLCRII